MVGFNSLNFSSIGVPTVGVKPSDIVDAYDNVMEKKNNYIAVTLANDKGTKERACATIIGANAGMLQAIAMGGLYALVKAYPKLNHPLIDRFLTRGFDKTIQLMQKNSPGHGKLYYAMAGFGVKALKSIAVGAALGFLLDWWATSRNTVVNGKISNTKSGVEGSWISSGLKSLSATDEGKEIIKNSIRKNHDKSVTVKFAGIDKEYTISKKELKDASRAYVTYTNDEGKVTGFKKKFSKGDGDALAFEVAYEKYCNEVLNTGEKMDKHLSDSVERITEQGDVLFTNGNVNQLYYLLTGKDTSSFSKQETDDKLMDMYSKASIASFIRNCKSNPERFAAEVKLQEGKNGRLKLRDRYLGLHTLKTDKNYVITNMTSKYVTISDSSNTRKSVDIPLSKLNNYIASISYVDLKNNELN